ncbi:MULTISPECIES: hypothetical protein [Ruminococcus]|jgi:hypothetical protein|uniref:Uncharacterized protein n=1 Tax=Ruminococcus flavefaciens TaxID=1265 RepID=A0A315Y498_RUMFL|nr:MULTISPECIES: hypothetical protein [Ruminococcus]MBR1430267.1 hypothetical protein [Ruminococcus sp.]PWJ15450.1 hypothetical protein IE37_00350 [Ruminococcus flavefaciens]SSA40611.1 hypothetical protein SAMN02910325_00350 [Ruminococcus flavefaciens]
MDNVCEFCAAKVVSGTLVTPYAVQFYPEGEEQKLKPKRSQVICDACPRCGHIQNLRLKNPENIMKYRYTIPGESV